MLLLFYMENRQEVTKVNEEGGRYAIERLP